MKLQEKLFFKQTLSSAVQVFINTLDENELKKVNRSSQKIFSAGEMWRIQSKKSMTLIR